MLISRDQIASRIQEVARELNGPFTLLALLKGAFVFAADLMRHLDPSCEIEFIRCASYTGTRRGELSIEGLDRLDLREKRVLVVDDIFDSGTTLFHVISSIEAESVQSIVLLMKEVDRAISYRPDYVLFEIPDQFVIGYGLDRDGKDRGLPDIHVLPG